MCSSLTVSHTTSPTPTGLLGTEREYILRHPKRTPSICIGDRDPAQDQGSMRGVAVDLHTHSPAESTPSVYRSELTLIPSLPSLMERGWGSCQTIAESEGVPWHLPTSQAGCDFMGDLHMPASKAAPLRPGLLPLSLQRPPKAPSGERVRTGATSGPPPHPSAQLRAWHKADVGE